MSIKTFANKNKRLERFYKTGSRKGINPDFAERLKQVLALLDKMTSLDAFDGLPGYRLHPLGGSRRGFWSVRISGNWRVTFRFDGQDVYDVSLEDYH